MHQQNGNGKTGVTYLHIIVTAICVMDDEVLSNYQIPWWLKYGTDEGK